MDVVGCTNDQRYGDSQQFSLLVKTDSGTMYSDKPHHHPTCSDDWKQDLKGKTCNKSSGVSRDKFHSKGFHKNFGRFSEVQAFKGAGGSYHRGNNGDLHHGHSFVNSMGRYRCYNNPRPGHGFVGNSRWNDNRKKFYYHAKGQTGQLKKSKRGGTFRDRFNRFNLKTNNGITPLFEIIDAKGHDVQSTVLSNNPILECNRDHINSRIHSTGLSPSTKVVQSPHLTLKSEKEEASPICESSFLCQSDIPLALVASKLQDGAAHSVKDTTMGVKQDRAFITCRNGQKRPRASAVRDYPVGCNKGLASVNISNSVCKNPEMVNGYARPINICQESSSVEIFQPNLVDVDKKNSNGETKAAATTGIQVCLDIAVFENEGGSNLGVSKEDTMITNEVTKVLQEGSNDDIKVQSEGGNEVLFESVVIGHSMEGDTSKELGRQSYAVVSLVKAVDPEDGLGVRGVEVIVQTPPSRNSPQLFLEDVEVLADSHGSLSNFNSSSEHALQGQNGSEMPKVQGVLKISDNAGALVPFQSNKRRASMKNKESGKIPVNSESVGGALVPYQSNKNKPSMKNKNLGRRLLHKGSCRLKIYQDSRSFDGAMLEDPEKALCMQADGGVSARTLVKRTLHEFESIRKMLVKSQDGVKDGIKRADLDAGGMMKEKGKWRNCNEEKIVGEVPGVEVGDQFSFRMEMLIIGLHRQVQAGIDYIPASRRTNKAPLATSIVASGGYEDDKDDGNVLIYTGQGGKDKKGGQESNQKLVRGNLALSNSMKEKSPVRVIRGTPDTASPSSKVYTYDGLYDVVGLRFEYGTAGYQVFHFTLIRRSGQPQVGLSLLSALKRKGVARPHLLLNDISKGQERVPVCVVNEVDDKPAPLHFTYIANMKYPLWYAPLVPEGCDCVGGCFDEKKCSCARKNGGEFPYNENGYLIRAKNLVFECGSSCRCSNSCQNRVSQKGLRYRLEIFKTEKRGWGVRSLNSIQSGGFICEYTGELLSDAEAEERVGHDEYLFDLENKCNPSCARDESIGVDGSSALVPVASNVAYTIDAMGMGNVARFINHSCSPNLYPQNVLYDSDDLRFPRVMLFAMESIPPMRELNYDYNYSLDNVHDAHGNVKTKSCYCGAQDCQGRLY